MNADAMVLELVTRRFLEAELELAQLMATLRTLESEQERIDGMRDAAATAIASLAATTTAAHAVFERLLPVVESLDALARDPGVGSIAGLPGLLEEARATVERSAGEVGRRVVGATVGLGVLNLVGWIGVWVWGRG